MKSICPNKPPLSIHESVLIVHFSHPRSSLTKDYRGYQKYTIKSVCPNKTPFFTHESVLIVDFPHPPSSLTKDYRGYQKHTMKHICPNKTPFFTHESVLIVDFSYPPSSLANSTLRRFPNLRKVKDYRGYQKYTIKSPAQTRHPFPPTRAFLSSISPIRGHLPHPRQTATQNPNRTEQQHG